MVMLRVKSVKSDWLRIRNDYSVHAPKIGPFQMARLLVHSTINTYNINIHFRGKEVRHICGLRNNFLQFELQKLRR